MRAVRVGIIGFGQVIRSFLEILPDKLEYIQRKYNIYLEIVAICDSTEYMLNPDGFDIEDLLAHKLSKNSTSDHSSQTLCTDIPMITDALLRARVDVVIEALPFSQENDETALKYLSGFLSNKVPVITCNRSSLLQGYETLYILSQKQQTSFRFAPALPAGLPCVDLAFSALTGTAIYGFEGIFDEIPNFLLTEMIRNKSSLSDEIEMALAMEICNENTSPHVEGWVTSWNTLLLARILLDPLTAKDNIMVQGIQGLTFEKIESVIENGDTIKLLGKASYKDDKLRLRVTPSIITPDHAFYNIEGTRTAVTYYTENFGNLTLQGSVSSPKSAACALLKELLHLFKAAHIF